jgi:uncharacterized protein (UPF0147 family)
MDKNTIQFMRRVLLDLEKDKNMPRAIRRLHMKEIHLAKKRQENDFLALLKKTRGLIR